MELEWTVGPQAVSESTSAQISMEAVGSQYHRWDGLHDGLAMFSYRILPPT